MSKIRSAVLISTLTQYSIQIINIGYVVVIARLLTPAELGVYAVASSLTMLAMEFRGLGVGPYLVREKTIDEQKMRAVMGVTIVTSWGLGLIVVSGSQFVASFYDEPALKYIFWIIAATFFISPFSSLPTSLLSRGMEFKKIFVIKFVGTVVLSASSIGLVLLGYSFYGLAFGSLIGLASEIIITNFFRPAGTPWLPSFKWMGDLVRFGLLNSATNMFWRFSESIPDLVLGKVATMADVGIFSRGLGLLLFFNRTIIAAVGPVILPHFSEVNRKGESVVDAYLKSAVFLGAFCGPVFAIVNVAAFPIIRVLFGDQWNFAVPVASILAFWAIFQSIHCFSSSLLTVAGKEKIMFQLGLLVLLVRFGLILNAAPYGLIMIAWAMVLSGLVEFLLNSWIIRKVIGLTMRKTLKAYFPNILLSAACWIAVYSLNYFVPFRETNPWESLVLIVLCVLPTWLLMLKLTKHGVWEFSVGLVRRYP